MIVSLSILNIEESKRFEKINEFMQVENNWIHFDVMDGVFVPNITYGPDFISSIKPYSQKVFDVHLMIVNPLPYIERFVKAGADVIGVHVEAKNVKKSLQLIKSFGVKSQIVIKPKTSYKRILKYLDFVDEVMVMSVEPGFGGQSFLYDVVGKMEKISSEIKEKNKKILLQVDGGINFDTAKLSIENGVKSLVVGSFLFKQKNFNQTVVKLKSLLP